MNPLYVLYYNNNLSRAQNCNSIVVRDVKMKLEAICIQGTCHTYTERISICLSGANFHSDRRPHKCGCREQRRCAWISRAEHYFRS